jgi:hypothetical protein
MSIITNTLFLLFTLLAVCLTQEEQRPDLLAVQSPSEFPFIALIQLEGEVVGTGVVLDEFHILTSYFYSKLGYVDYYRVIVGGVDSTINNYDGQGQIKNVSKVRPY